MKTVRMVLLFVIIFLTASPALRAQDAATEAKLQFSSLFLGTTNSFKTLKGEKYADDENWTYFASDYGLGERAATILQSKKDTAQWYCYVKFSYEDDLNALPAVQSGIFDLLNMVVKGGKIKGEEKTENNVVRTDLFATKNDEWLGEVVSDNNKKTFHVFLKNVNWQ